MADMNATPARAGLTPQIWDKLFFAEYIRANRFKKYFGTTESSMIQVKDSLTTKNGDTITFAAVRRLVGAGVTGNTVLEGNEEILDQRSMKLTVAPIRHAVAVSEWDEQKSTIELRDVAKTSLKNWSMEKLRSDIITSLSSVGTVNGVTIPYATATATQRNLWLASNSDRVRFGAAAANYSAGVMATALATLTVANDKMTGAMLSLAKRKAQTASPHIRPIMTVDTNDEEWFVVFMPSLVFRDFRNDPAVITANANGRPRETGWMKNPMFSGGDLVWDGMIVRELPEFPVLAGAGNAGIDVAASFLCGAQAIGAGWAQRTRTTTNVRDYSYFHGVGVSEIRGIGKLCFGRDPNVDTTTLVDQGVFTIFTPAVSDV
jgi:N4-gp56 family major capsid protein